MMNRTKLIINRVVIHSGIKTVYDEDFHVGLNVIRGDNGTGKSTIMELISYGLGGDIKKNSWKKQALDCTSITISLSANKTPYVFRRYIEGESSKPPIHIYEGVYEEAVEKPDEWDVFKNKKGEGRSSYSMRIFDLLGLEQHVTEEDNSLTLHQMLRLLYIDQDTPASKIFRTEPFIYDTETMRKAIGEYFFGFDNLEAHSLRQELYRAEKEFKKVEDELKTIYSVLGQTNIKVSIDEIESNIKSLNLDLQRIAKERDKYKDLNLKNTTEEVDQEQNKVREEIERQSSVVASLEDDFTDVNYEIVESLEFLKALKDRSESLSTARKAFNSLHPISFKCCPSCNSEIVESTNDDECSLCGSKNKSGVIENTYIESLNQLDFQISETKGILEEQVDLKSELTAKIKKAKEYLNRLKLQHNRIATTSNDYEIGLTKLATEEGFILSQIENFRDKIGLAEKLKQKMKNKSDLQLKINNKSQELLNLESKRKKRIKSVSNKISDKVTDLLKKDGGFEEDFDSSEKFEYDFSTDSLRLDGRANFSASSNVILKNTFHLASLFIAVGDDQFRLPCFSMFDNIEDKGMREDRSKNYQKIIVEVCNQIETDFQIIMTTSMVDETLNNNKYGVGDYYEKGMHTLNFDE